MASSAAEPARAGDASPADVLSNLETARRQFLALIEHVRPELLRYCARMTGSVADGEDVVQDTLAHACYELPQLKALPALRPWLFRIAHNRAVDHWRRESHRDAEPLDAALDVADASALQPDNLVARREAVRAAIGSFLALPPAQRACVILKDVLEHSLEEIGVELNLSLPAIKAALHRGRAALLRSGTSTPHVPRADASSQALGRYARLFDAHDWSGVRQLLADDVRLDLVSRRKASGKADVANYFENYERTGGWRVTPARFEGREVLAVHIAEQARPAYFVEIGWTDGLVTSIRDFRYVSYITQEGEFEL